MTVVQLDQFHPSLFINLRFNVVQSLNLWVVSVKILYLFLDIFMTVVH